MLGKGFSCKPDGQEKPAQVNGVVVVHGVVVTVVKGVVVQVAKGVVVAVVVIALQHWAAIH